ncbi:MAG: MBL fold metallo-hydrolase, partial [Actinobacteria bacterium]|nr:MBL fold metallo-hydrolase [Actinomycetota bacterium]
MAHTEQPKPASQHTTARNAAVTTPTDAGDFERATRGFIASLPTGRVESADGRMVADVNRYNFIRENEKAPETVNPSLWRHARLNANHGLFEVADGVWQVRGYDISNITFIKGTEGWVVIDPLTTEATARASYDLITAQLGHRPVTAVIYTHSHADHFGGVLGVTTQAEVDAGKCRVIAPVGFLHETVGENVIAGPAMNRRATYQFGPLLPAGPTGHVDCGLGNSVPLGPPGLIAPTEDITFTGEELVVDGVRIVFQLTPETEAPAEMNFFFPDQGWLCMAENCSHTMHNLVPIRGALVRNSLKWTKYINEAMELFGADTKILFTSHNWPRWGNEDLLGFLTLQRDVYRWMHDQTMRLANKGYTATEISAALTLPDEFLANDHTRGYYGDLVHNSKAVYQRYLSWYDANPANLNKYQPTEAGARYVALAGGADALLKNARAAFDAGDYRWVVELVNHLVFADPTNTAARHLQADALEQLGYQAESSTFRNAYLMGAQELRQGPPKPASNQVRGRGLLLAMTVEQVFDSLAVRMKSEELGGVSVCVNWDFTDTKEQWVLGISNRTLYYTPSSQSNTAAATVRLARTTLIDVVTQSTTFVDQIQAGNIVIDGDAAALLGIFGNIDTF